MGSGAPSKAQPPGSEKLRDGKYISSASFKMMHDIVQTLPEDELAIIADVITYARCKANAKGYKPELSGNLLNEEYTASASFQQFLASAQDLQEDQLAALANVIKFVRVKTNESPPPFTAPERAELKEKWSTVEALKKACGTNDTLLLDGAWLVKEAIDGKILPKRQQLPDGAGVDPKALVEKLYPETSWNLAKETKLAWVIVAISYCWATAQHPDPAGEQLQRLRVPLQLMLEQKEEKRGGGFGDKLLWTLAVFLDWCSLHQAERTEDELQIFKRGLKAVNIWYGHPLTWVFALTLVPVGVKPYSERGWPCFEKAVGTMIKDASLFLDLGYAEGYAMENKGQEFVTRGGTYMGPGRRFLPTHLNGKEVMKCQSGSLYLADNVIGAESPGISYRLSKSLDDRDPEEDAYLAWGETITAVSEADGWIEVVYGLGYVAGDLTFKSFRRFLMCARGSRGTPVVPSEFREKLLTLSFTNGSDRAFVLEKYESTFTEIFSSAAELSYAGLEEITGFDERFFEWCPQLEYINLSSLRKLKALPSSFGNLRECRRVTLHNCESLANLPENIGNLQACKMLDLSGCESLTRLPDSIGDLQECKELMLDGCESLTRLPDSIGSLRKLERLTMPGCTSLESLPDSIGSLQACEVLDLEDCTGLTSLPDSIRNRKDMQIYGRDDLK